MKAPQTITNRLMRLEAACQATGKSRSGLYADCARGLMTRPIKIGARAAAFPVYEVEAINAARIAGASDAQLRDLVGRLEADRAKAFVAAVEA